MDTVMSQTGMLRHSGGKSGTSLFICNGFLFVAIFGFVLVYNKHKGSQMV